MATRTKIGKHYVIRNQQGQIKRWIRMGKRARVKSAKDVGKRYGIKSIWN